MALEQALPAAAAAASSLAGVALQASRRNRLKRRVDSYLSLAERLDTHDAATATDLRAIARETTLVLVERDRKALRQVDPATVAAMLFLIVPAVVGLIFTAGWDSGWKWLVGAVLILWILVWLGVGLSQIRKDEN